MYVNDILKAIVYIINVTKTYYSVNMQGYKRTDAFLQAKKEREQKIVADFKEKVKTAQSYMDVYIELGHKYKLHPCTILRKIQNDSTK